MLDFLFIFEISIALLNLSKNLYTPIGINIFFWKLMWRDIKGVLSSSKKARLGRIPSFSGIFFFHKMVV